MTLGTARVIQGDATHLPLADSSVDLVITSPPYFGLRSYQDGGQHYDGQLGDEPTPREYVNNLITATTEMVRVLKPTGSIWVNLGDKYNSAASGQNGAAGTLHTTNERMAGRGDTDDHIRPKSLMGIPWRYALRCVDDLGLILRAEIIWSKPNGLPESMTDRVRRSHETWFHFTKQPRYYSAIDHIREEAQQERPQARRARALAAQHGLTDAHRDALLARGLGDTGRSAAVQTGTGKNTTEVQRLAAEADRALGGYAREFTMTSQALGKLPGSVWEIPTQPLTVPDWLGVDHYAAFPIEWPRRIINGWSPPAICTACGQGRRPTTDKDRQPTQRIHNGRGFMSPGHGGRDSLPHRTLVDITGYACDCPTPNAPTTPAVVLDPFGGTGTVALAAKALGRHGITLDMSADYNRIATWRCSDPGQLAAALHVDKPPVEHDGQLDLLDGLLG